MSSFFGGGQPQQPQGPDPVYAAKTEMEMYTGKLKNGGNIHCGATGYCIMVLATSPLLTWNAFFERSFQQDFWSVLQKVRFLQAQGTGSISGRNGMHGPMRRQVFGVAAACGRCPSGSKRAATSAAAADAKKLWLNR